MDYRPKCKIQTMKLLEDNIHENLDNLGYGNDPLNTTPKTHFIKGILISWTSLKLKKKKDNFCSLKDNVKRLRRR